MTRAFLLAIPIAGLLLALSVVAEAYLPIPHRRRKESTDAKEIAERH